MQHYYAYIDEAGDEGFGKLRNLATRGGQSTWLMIGAIIVTEENDKLLPAWRDELRAKFPQKRHDHLHWANLNHDQRVVVAQGLADKKLGVALTMSHKVTIPGSLREAQFKKPQFLYNYLVRWLLERLITACQAHAAPEAARLHLTFSRRRGTDYIYMRDYLRKLANKQDVVKAPRVTDWAVLDIEKIKVENHAKRAGLQLADCATSAFFNALEPNQFGNTEPAYAMRLARNLLHTSGKVQGEGLTVVPNIGFARCDAQQIAFLRSCWKRT